jgi:hypothetical protein
MIESLLTGTVGKFITQFGFPVVLSLLLLGFIFTLLKWQREDRIKWEAEMKAMQLMNLEVIKQSAEAMTKLCLSLENAIGKAQDNQRLIIDELRRR